MKQILKPVSVNQKLAVGALALGFLAIFAGNPYKGNTATLNTKDLAVMVEKEVDHVTVDELAHWVIQGKVDYRLVDLRTPKEFAAYHIPTAENIPIASLLDGGLMRNDKIILYSDGGIHSAQAWFLLKAVQYNAVYMLRDGLNEWKDRILFPALADNATDAEKAAFEKQKQVSLFFGGSPRTGIPDAESSPQIALPKLDMPAAAVAPAGVVKKKKKEGC